MLNNTKYKSQSSDLHQCIDSQLVTKLNGIDKEAANATQFDQVKSAERSIRRERRYSQTTGSNTGAWRVAL